MRVQGDEGRAASSDASDAVIITPTGIIDGDRDVLAALSERCGCKVLGYCRLVAAPGLSTEACAQAFARFRLDVAEATDPEALDPEAALLRATRYAAAAHAPQFEPAVPRVPRRAPVRARCPDASRAIAARECGEISPTGRRRLAAHLRRCDACREAEARALAAERAFREPSIEELPAAVASAILTALEQAFPDGAAVAQPADGPLSEHPPAAPELTPQPVDENVVAGPETGHLSTPIDPGELLVDEVMPVDPGEVPVAAAKPSVDPRVPPASSEPVDPPEAPVDAPQAPGDPGDSQPPPPNDGDGDGDGDGRIVSVAGDITRSRIRDGDPTALAALCERCGSAVFAHCEQVTRPGHAISAAADAFAQFRMSIVPPDELTGDEAGALLRSLTRRAAAWQGVNAMAARDGRTGSGSCTGLEIELIDYIEDRLSPAERKSVTEHIASCGLCAAGLRRLKAAEQAFERPPRAPLPLVVAEQLLQALVLAAPVLAHDGNFVSVRHESMRLLTGDRTPAADPTPPPVAPKPAPPIAMTPEPDEPTAGSRDHAAADRSAGSRLPVRWTRLLAQRRRGRSGPFARRRPGLLTVLVLLAVIGAIVALAILSLSSDATPSRPSSPAQLVGPRETTGDEPPPTTAEPPAESARERPTATTPSRQRSARPRRARKPVAQPSTRATPPSDSAPAENPPRAPQPPAPPPAPQPPAPPPAPQPPAPPPAPQPPAPPPARPPAPPPAPNPPSGDSEPRPGSEPPAGGFSTSTEGET